VLIKPEIHFAVSRNHRILYQLKAFKQSPNTCNRPLLQLKRLQAEIEAEEWAELEDQSRTVEEGEVTEGGGPAGRKTKKKRV
jgi:hypothetical protein